MILKLFRNYLQEIVKVLRTKSNNIIKVSTDSVLHIIFCASCAITTSLIMSTIVDTPLPAILSGFISGLCLGIGKEYGDSKAQGNEWSWGDIVYDIIGAGIGSIGGFINLLINL